MGKLLEISNLKKDYYNISETLHILRGIDFSINPGDTVAVTGESGSGKSTFLNMIGGLDSVSEGSIKIEGIEITELDEYEMAYFRNKKIGFIFQSHFLLEEFNAVENVMMPFYISSFSKRKAYNKSRELLDFVGLKDRFHHYPSQLSGGEKQRVAIARAFINSPSIILADEPTGNLDKMNASRVLELLFNIPNEERHSLIIVSHSSHVTDMAKKNYHLENGILSLRR